MATIDKEWLFVRRNIRYLRSAADAAGDDQDTPQKLKRYFTDLEEVARKLEQALRQYEA